MSVQFLHLFNGNSIILLTQSSLNVLKVDKHLFLTFVINLQFIIKHLYKMQTNIEGKLISGIVLNSITYKLLIYKL